MTQPHAPLISHFLEASLHTWDEADTKTELACCNSARQLLAHLYGEAVVSRVPAAWWALDIQGGAPGPWSTVDALVEAGIATSVFDPRLYTPLAGTVLACQGWRGTPLAPGVSGHRFDLWVGAYGVWQFGAVVSRRYDARARGLEEVFDEFPHLRVAQLLHRAVVLG